MNTTVIGTLEKSFKTIPNTAINNTKNNNGIRANQPLRGGRSLLSSRTFVFISYTFDCKVKKDAKVKEGQLLIEFDQSKIESLNCDDITMLVVLNQGNAKAVKFIDDSDVKANETVIANIE